MAVTVPQLLSRRDIDLVVICTPHDLHCAQIIEAADAGKHVLVEKPIGIDLHAAEDAVRYCKARGIVLGVVHPRRFDETWITIRDAIYEQTLGRLLWIDTSVLFYRTPDYYASSWRGRHQREVGPHLTQAIHHLDIIRWLMDAAEPPAMEVAASASLSGTLLNPTETADSMAAQFRTIRGTFGTVRVSTGLPSLQTARMELFFEDGVLGIADDLIVSRSPSDKDRFAELRSGTCGWGTDGASRVIADMCDAVRQRREPRVSGSEAVRTLRFCLSLFATSGGSAHIRRAPS
jgi:predicted dehydrogenase